MEFTTPVGKLVQGDCFKGSTTNQDGTPRTIKTGPNKGNPTTSYFFAVAYPKLLANGAPNEPFYKLYREIIDVARAGYPQLFTGPVDGFTGKPGSVRPTMSYKVIDGDGVDENGVQNNTKPGFAGCYVIRFGGQYAPKCFELGKFRLDQQLQDPARVKKGYLVSVSGTCEPNIGSDKPGVYMNGNLVCLVATCPDSEVITNGPDADAAFKGLDVTALPAGYVAGATAATAPGLPPAGGLPPAPASTAPGLPPVTGGLPPAPAPAASLPAPPAGPQLTPAGIASGYTYDQYKAAGYNDDLLRSKGFLA